MLQMLSEVSVDEVFMHYFEKMSSASGASPQTLTRVLPLDPAGVLPSVRPPSLPTPRKNPAGPMDESLTIRRGLAKFHFFAFKII